MSYRQDPRDQYYNNNQYNQYQGYTDGYQQGQLSSNPRMQNDGYRPPIRNPYSTPNPNVKGPPRGRTTDDDDNESVVSSVYSQPSVAGFAPSNNMRYYQEQSLETTEPRRQSLSYNEYDYPYPPSPFAASTNTHNSATGLTTGSSQQGLTDNMGENYYQDNYQDYSQNNYQDNSQNNYQDHSQNNYQDHSQNNYQDHSQKNYQDHSQNNYQDYSQNTQPQYDVYNDFNNNFKNDEKYNDGESRNNTLIGPDGSHDPNPYAVNVDSGNGKGARQSTSGDHYVVTPKKERRCAFCSRKTCVIITFIILILLAAGMYFVWPRIPVVTFLSPSAAGDAEITTTPTVVKMPMELQFQLDNRENWLPYKFNSLHIDVLNVANLKTIIASSDKKGFSIPGRAKSTVSIPLPINYQASGQNDPILQDFIESCTQPQEHSLKLRVDMKMFILGLDWVKKPTVSIPVIDFPCPFNITRPPTADQTPPAPTDETNSASAPPTDGTPAPGGTPAPAPGGAPAPAPGGAPAPAPGGAPAPAPGGAPAPAPGGAAPAPGGAPAPAPGGAAPGAAPAPGGATPAPGGAAPAPGGATPAPGGAAPAPGGAAPAPGGAAPAPGGAAPAPGGAAPAPGAAPGAAPAGGGP